MVAVMEGVSIKKKLHVYYLTTLFSVAFALLGFSYNAWRMEVTEDNENVRTAAFEVLTNIAELEQIIFAIHYDKNPDKGNPRDGWAKLGLIYDLCSMISKQSMTLCEQVKLSWQRNWPDIEASNEATEVVIADLEALRLQIRQDLKQLD